MTDPASGKVLDRVATPPTADAAEAIAAAAAAFDGWSTLTAYQRADKLAAAHQLMLERREDLAKMMTSEQGKPLRAARNEVGYAADFLLWFAEEAKRVYGQTIPSSRADQRFLVLHQPVGRLRRHHAVELPGLHAHPEARPGAGRRLHGRAQAGRADAAVRRRGVQDLRRDRPAAGRRQPGAPRPTRCRSAASCSTNPAVRKLTLHRLHRGRQALMALAAPPMKRVSMELGGHAPFIVFDDADPARAATGAAMVKVLNTGQACICPNRLYVQRRIVDAFVEALAGRVAKMQAGSGFTDGVQIGPLVDEAAMDKVDRQVATPWPRAPPS